MAGAVEVALTPAAGGVAGRAAAARADRLGRGPPPGPPQRLQALGGPGPPQRLEALGGPGPPQRLEVLGGPGPPQRLEALGSLEALGGGGLRQRLEVGIWLLFMGLQRRRNVVRLLGTLGYLWVVP